MIKPLISVVITTWNRANHLGEALSSVVEQSYTPTEIIVVDDASTDHTEDLVGKLACEYDFTYVRHQKRLGLAAARNTGIKNSNGIMVAFLDDDDRLEKNSLERRFNTLFTKTGEHKKVLEVVHSGCRMDFKDEDRSVVLEPKIEGDIQEYITSKGLSSLPSTILFPKKLLETIGGFDESLVSSIDHDMWMNLALHKYSAKVIKEPLTIVTTFKDKRSMVSEINTRVIGVEQFLNKWKSYLIDWMGVSRGKRYIKKYRAQVLGDFAGRLLLNGKLISFYKITFHIIGKNKFSPLTAFFMLKIIFKPLIRHHLSKFIVL